jgi:ketosteroid isomerase-like protein
LVDTPSISQQNVEIVRRFCDCWQRLDWDGMVELLDPAVEQLGTVGGVEERSVRRGTAEMRRGYESSEEMWAEHRVEMQELIGAGDRVVVVQREYQRGRASGVELVIDTAAIFELRDGLIVRIQGYMDPAEALSAAGVPAR